MRKRRTREHVIADLSVNCAERAVLRAGFMPDRVLFDYGYDLIIRTVNAEGYVEPDYILFQLKASDAPEYVEGRRTISVRLDPRDADTWGAERVPVILVFYDAPRDCAYWLHFQPATRVGRNTIHAPTSQMLDETAVREFRRIKNRALGIPH